MQEHIELPRPWRLLWTAGVSLGESAGLPLGAYLIADWLYGNDTGLLTGLGAVWMVAAVRKILTGTVPGLLVISVLLLAVQTALVFATGQTWIYLVQFPLAKFLLCVLFARSAPTSRPLADRLAREMIALRHPAAHYPDLHRFFQGATWLWSGIFFALAVVFTVLVATQPIPMFMVLSTVVTAGIFILGLAVSLWWFFSVLRRLGLRLRFTPA